MDIWFVKTKALFFAEELLSLLSDLTTEIKKNKEKNFTENEVKALSNELYNVLGQKVSELKKDQHYNDARFISFFQLAIVGLIDDVFLTITWSGRQFWALYLLEMRVFGTRASGDIFFENCRTIVQSQDGKSKELASIYHLCITAGFRGKYYNIEYNQDLNVYRTDLYNVFNGAEVSIHNFDRPAILSSGYAPNNSKSLLSKKYSISNRLLFINLILIIIFIITSYFVWINNPYIIFRNF